MDILLVAWLHVLWMISIQFLTHDRTREYLLHSSGSSSDSPLVGSLHLLLLPFLVLFQLSPFKNLSHPPAKIVKFKVGSSLWTLVLLACVFIGVDAFVVLEVDLVTVILNRQTVCSCSLVVVIFLYRLSFSVRSAVIVVLTRLSLLILRSHFVKFEWLFNWKFQKYSI